MGVFAEEPGTTYVIKGEPSATDAARLRHSLTADQRAELREIMRARLAAFQPDATTDEEG